MKVKDDKVGEDGKDGKNNEVGKDGEVDDSQRWQSWRRWEKVTKDGKDGENDYSYKMVRRSWRWRLKCYMIVNDMIWWDMNIIIID